VSNATGNDRLTRRSLFRSALVVVGVPATPALLRPAAAQTEPRKSGALRYRLSFERRRKNQLNTTRMTDATQGRRSLHFRAAGKRPADKLVIVTTTHMPWRSHSRKIRARRISMGSITTTSQMAPPAPRSRRPTWTSSWRRTRATWNG
jgi:hypothetical protein